MPLSKLVGRECGESNSLMHITHHLTNDKAHRQDRIPHPVEEDLQRPVLLPNSSDQLINEFTNTSAFQPMQPYRMDALLREMNEIDSRSVLEPPVMVHPEVTHFTQPSIWNQNHYPAPILHNQLADIWANEAAVTAQMQPDLDAAWANSSNRALVEHTTNTWRNEFNPSDVAREKVSTLESLGAAEALDFPYEEAKELLNYDFDQAWKTSDWEREYENAQKTGNFDNVTTDSEAMSPTEKEEFWNNLQAEWDTIAKEKDGSSHPWLDEYDQQMDSHFEDYKFQEDNEYKDHPDPLSEGKGFLEQGDLPTAILMFEAAAQKSPENGEAWLLLGTTHAENEQDPLAIAALRKCVQIEPKNLIAWMALATSYTNESYQNYACHALKEWLASNDEYKHLVKVNAIPSPVGSIASSQLIEDTKNLFFQAANLRHGSKIDYDVQCGIGTLLNITGDYEKAIDCFNLALQVRPQEAKLWNKLGASMANGDRSAEAIEAYRNALELSPGYIRCRYNLGIACIKLGAHRDAIGHFLEALNMQENVKIKSSKSKIVVSDSIWSTLRISIGRLNSPNLITAVQKRDLLALNKEFSSGKIN